MIAGRCQEKLFTPHARGSPYADPRRWFCSQIYPAGAGINPIRYASGSQSIDLPRRRGDQPASGTDRADMPAFTPHARGSTLVIALSADVVYIYPACAGITLLCPKGEKSQIIYPACAGINLGYADESGPKQHLPRMRGDQP